MSSTYSNLGIELIGTGEQAGTWGATTNSNFSTIIDNAIVGYKQVTLTSAATSAVPNTLNVASGVASDGQKRVIEVYSAADLGGDVYLQVTPNTFAGYYFIKNSLAGSRSLRFFQGTYSVGNTVLIENGYEAIVKCNGGGAGAIVSFVNYNLKLGNTWLQSSTATDAFRITQTGAGNALVVEDDTNPDGSPFLIEANGRVVSGYTAATTTLGGATYRIQSLTSGGESPLLLGSTSASPGSGGTFSFIRNKAAAWGTNTTVVADDLLGTVQFMGANGTTYMPAASISVSADSGLYGGAASIPGRIVFNTQSNGASALTERMRIDSNGNVGIGAVPSSSTAISLNVTKDLTGSTIAYGVRSNGVVQSDVTSTAAGYLSQIGTAAGATPTSLVYYYTSQGTISGGTPTAQYGFLCSGTPLTGATSNYAFYAANQDVAPLTSGRSAYSFYSSMSRGGTTSTATYAFYASGTAYNYFNGNTGIGIAPNAAYQCYIAGVDASSTNYALRVNNSTTTIMTFRNDGTLNTGTLGSSPYNNVVSATPKAVYVSSAGELGYLSSSLRYKNNIENIQYGLSEVMQLRPVSFNYKANPDDPKSLGFIAEEIETVGVKEAVYYKDGLPDSLNYESIIPLLTKAIQEQQAMIEELKARVAALGG